MVHPMTCGGRAVRRFWGYEERAITRAVMRRIRVCHGLPSVPLIFNTHPSLMANQRLNSVVAFICDSWVAVVWRARFRPEIRLQRRREPSPLRRCVWLPQRRSSTVTMRQSESSVESSNRWVVKSFTSVTTEAPTRWLERRFKRMLMPLRLRHIRAERLRCSLTLRKFSTRQDSIISSFVAVVVEQSFHGKSRSFEMRASPESTRPTMGERWA